MKKVKYYALALVLVLGLVGGVYAAWTDAVTIEADMDTAYLETQFEGGSDCDIEDDGEDVATTECDIENDGKLLEVTIDNAYPGYWSTVSLNVVNNGTIPVRVTDIDFDGDYDIEDVIEATLDGIEVDEVIDPEEEVPVTVKTEIFSEAGQAETYEFTVDIDFIQWNQ